jgi:hypothetical protein
MTQFQNKRLRNRPLLSWNREYPPNNGMTGNDSNDPVNRQVVQFEEMVFLKDIEEETRAHFDH